MAHASSLCPSCGEEFISMSSTVLCRQRRLRHIAREHMPEARGFNDPVLERNGEVSRPENVELLR